MQLNGDDYAWMTGENPAPLYSNDVLLVCIAGEAWECYKKLNCFLCHGENHRRVWWTFHCQFKTSNDPTSLIIQMQSIQSRDVASVFILGKD